MYSNSFTAKMRTKFSNFILFASATLFLGSGFTYRKYAFLNSANNKGNSTPIDDFKGHNPQGLNIETLPIYTRKEVMEHCTLDKRIWITYQDGVYDITDFIKVHPGGGEKLMMIAGGILDPFWEMYSFHKRKEILEVLEKYRIGTLDPKDHIDKSNLPNFDAIKKETIFRSPYLKVLLDFPFNAECPGDKLAENFYTPNEYFFIRNHNLVPEIEVGNYKLVIKDELSGRKKKFKMEDLKKNYRCREEEAIMMCTGNRRTQMNKPKPPKGLGWTVGSIANGLWEGVVLRDILSEFGYNKTNSQGLHLIATGWDKDMQGEYYSVSIPLDVVFSEDNEVLLAYGYNGTDIPYEHGFPLRLVIPGFVGVRNVKWLKSLEISTEEAQGPFQQRDYKIVPKDQEWDKTDLSQLPALMKHILNSAILDPADGQKIKKDQKFKIKGWAIGNYGSSIKSIQVSLDKGKTWKNVNSVIRHVNENNKSYGWSLWEYSTDPSDLSAGEHEVWVKAEDMEGNQQPLDCEDIWNVRGLMNNAVHKVKINLV